MGIIGEKIILITYKDGGTDPLGAKLPGEEVREPVYNVLVGEASAEEIVNELKLNGKRLAYTLAIPKGDTHKWTDALIELPYPWNCTVKTYGPVTYGIEKNIPGDWNGKVKCERYE